MIEYSHPTTGWRAECRWCPGVVEPDYGALVHPHEEFPDTDDGKALADTWALRHRRRLPGHSPTVTLVHRFTMTVVEHLDLRLLDALLRGRPVPSPLDELVHAVQWARNVAWSELGIEPLPARPLAIAGYWKRVDPPRMPVDWLYPPPAGWWDVGKLGPEGIR